MKRTIIILAMLLIAATAYNQTSRKPANTETTARRTTREVADNTRPSHERTTNVDARQRTSQSSTTRTSRTAVPKTRSETASTDRTYTRSSSTANSSGRTSARRPESTSTRTNRATSSRANTAVKHSSNRTRTVDRTAYHRTNSNNHAKHETNRARTATQHAHTSPRLYTEKHSTSHYYHHKPANRYYRAKHYAYRAPVELSVMWTPTMHRHYARMYPSVSYWSYRNGHNINMVSTYFADYYIGDVMTVYGKVTEVFYSGATDEYFLYFGLYYPHQDFTMVLPGYLARRYSHHPQRYFTDRHIASTGLVTNFGGEAEIVVRESFQLHLY